MNTTNSTINNTNTNLGGDTMYKLSQELIALKRNNITLKARDVVEARHIFATPDRYNILDIVIEENEEKVVVSEQVIGLSENRLFDMQKASTEMVTIYNKNVSMLYKNFVSKYVQITLNGDNVVKQVKSNNYEVYIGADGSIYFKTKFGYKEMHTEDEVMQLPNDAKLYRMLLSSAGDYKVARSLFYRVDDENESYKAIVEKATPGFFDNMESKLKIKDAAKKMSRMGLLKTTGKMATYLNNFIIYNSGVLDTVSGTSDGYCLTNALYYVDLYNLQSEAEACRIAEQDRLGCSQKFTTNVFQNELFHVKSSEIFNEVSKQSVRTENNDGVTKYIDKNRNILMIVVGDFDKATHIFDKNTNKAMVNYTKKINRGLTVMALSHLSEGKLNSQVNEKIFIAGTKNNMMEEVEEFYNNLYKEQATDLIKDILQKEKENIRLDNNYPLAALQSMCPNNPITLGNRYSASMNILKKRISGLSFKLKFKDGSPASYNMMLSCDPTAVFGKKLLKDDEVFCAGIARKIEKMGDKYDGRFDTAVITKAPSTGVLEYKKSHFLSFKEIHDRIDKLDVSNDMKRMLKFKFDNSPEGVIYFPSDDKEYLRLAGSDNDGDKVQVYFCKFMNKLLNKNFVVHVDTSKANFKANIVQNDLLDMLGSKMDLRKIKYSTDKKYVGTMWDVDSTLPGKVFTLNTIGLNSMTGSNYNKRISDALNDINANNDLTAAKAILNELNITEGSENRSLSINEKLTNSDFADSVKKDMGKVIWTKENIIAFLSCCEGMFNSSKKSSVGLITFYNNKIIAALEEAYDGNYEPAKLFLKECLLTEGYEDRKLIVNDYLINERFVRNVRRDMGKVVWTKENIEQFLFYCNEIFRLYQEGTIDSTKTGIYLSILIKCDSLSIERLYKLQTIGTGLDQKIVRNVTYKDRILQLKDDNGKIVKVPTMHFVDKMGAIENKLINRTNNEFSSIIKDNVDLFKYTDEQMASFKQTLDYVNSVRPDILSSLYTCKRLYNKIVSSKSEEYDEKKNNDQYYFEISSLENAVRYLVEQLDFSQFTSKEKESLIAELLLGVGCSWGVNRYDEFSQNKFAYTVCKEYAYAYFVGGLSYVASDKIVTKGLEEDGQTVTLSRGVSARGLITKSKYTGEVVISDDMVYAKRSFDYKFSDTTKAMLVFRNTAEMKITKNSSIAVGEDGYIYFYSDVTSGAEGVVVGKAAQSKLFTGEVESDYYIDCLDSITIQKVRIGNDYKDINYAVAYLTK